MKDEWIEMVWKWIEMKVLPSASEIKVFTLWKLQLITYLVSREQSEWNGRENNLCKVWLFGILDDLGCPEKTIIDIGLKNSFSHGLTHLRFSIIKFKAPML